MPLVSKKRMTMALITVSTAAIHLFFPPLWGGNYKEGSFVLSLSGVLAQYSPMDYTGEKLSLLPRERWGSLNWPCYNDNADIMYLEANREPFGGSSHIISTTLLTSTHQPIILTMGKMPSLCPNGEFVAFYRHPNQLWIFEVKTKDSKLLISDIIDIQPAVWISNRHLLYTNTKRNMLILDIISGNITNTGHQDIIPSVLSPSGTHILCGNYNGDKIFLYTPKDNTLKLLKNSKILSLGTSFVWFPSEQAFLYSRQSFWNNLIKFKEGQNLYIHPFDKKEKKLADQCYLTGGFFYSGKLQLGTDSR